MEGNLLVKILGESGIQWDWLWDGSNRCRTPRFPNPFVERLIRTIRREYLDRTFFWNAVDLERKLDEFRDYYTSIVFIARLTASRQRDAAGHRHPPPPPSIDMPHGRIAAVYFGHSRCR